VARRLQNARQQIADLDHVGIGDTQIDIGDFSGLVVRRDDAAIVFPLEFGDPPDMIAVVSAARMGPASGASIDAVALVSTSWIR